MKLVLRHFLAGVLLAFLPSIAPIASETAAAADAQPVKAARDAHQKFDREDLAAPIREKGEVRVIVGLKTPEELAEAVARIPDRAKEQAVSARQLRVLQRLAGHNLRKVSRLRHHHFLALTADAAALAALLADPEVTSVTEDRPVYPVLHDTPGITRADLAWAEGYRGAGQTVAIIDTGVDKTHPFFSGKVVAEACFSEPDGSTSYCPGGISPSIGPGAGVPCPDSGCWHGTHVAGIAAGRYGILSSTTGGLAADANVIAIQVFQRECVGAGCGMVAFYSDLLAALDHVYSLRTTHNIASANMSLGGDLYTAPCDASLPAFRTIIESLRGANIATVIAAGNAGNAGGLSAPACVSNAISVGSTTKQNTISSFSNSASFLSLLAPGSGILSSVPGGYGGANGTSMATPHVAGAWALLKSAKPSATVAEVLTALQSTGVPITDPRNGIVKPLIQIGNNGAQLGALGVVLGSPSSSAVLGVSPTSVAAGGSLTASWSGIASPSPTDWIGLYAPGAANAAYIDWIYVSCSKVAGAAQASGSCTFGIPGGLAAGNYELRLLANNSLTTLATSGAFTVTGGGGGGSTVLSVSPASVPAGGSLTASWSGIASPSSTDWIGLYTPGAANAAFIEWIYVSCSKTPGGARASGSCTFGIPGGLAPGNYELRLFANNGFTTLANSGAFTVTGGGASTVLSVSPASVPAGGSLTASWSGIASPSSTDWIGLYNPGAANTAFIEWIYVSCSKTPGGARASGSCTFGVPGGLASGNYELRLLANNGFTHLAVSGGVAVSGGSAAPPIVLQSFASGFMHPVGIEHAGDRSGRLFILQQEGQIRIINNQGQVLPTSFLDIQPLIVSGGERGLLGVAFHPRYADADNGFFYVNYTRSGDGATVIARYRRSTDNPDIADPLSGVVLLTVAQPFTNHKGGQLRFGPDGYLYIGLGDGGSANDPGRRAQDLTTALGKMLRIDVDGGSPYAIPASNPFQSQSQGAPLREIWAYGLRNPWRFSFDRATGDLFIADVGQSAREEINFQPAGAAGGTNYGWRWMEGTQCTGLEGACPDPFTLPILEYSHALGCSVTGGHRYRGPAYPALSGYFLYGDFCSGRIWGATNAGGNWTTTELLVTGLGISTFGEDEAGEIYVAVHNTGVIYRIVRP